MKKILLWAFALILVPALVYANITMTIVDNDTMKWSSAASAGPTWYWENTYGAGSEGTYFYFDQKPTGVPQDDSLIHTTFFRGKNTNGVLTNVIELWTKILETNDGDEAGFFELEGLINTTVEVLASFIYFYGDVTAKGYAELIFNQEAAKMNVSIRGESGDNILESDSESNTLLYSTHHSITASTIQQQGQVPLVDIINNVAGVFNDGDAVTMPSAKKGMSVVVCNNGAKVLAVYPASGDNMGNGLNQPYLILSGSNVEFVAYDTTNWEVL